MVFMFVLFAALAVARRESENWELPILLVEDGSHIAKESQKEDFLTASERFAKRLDQARRVQTNTKKKYIESIAKKELIKAFAGIGLGENAAELFRTVGTIERKLEMLEMLYGQLDGEIENRIGRAQRRQQQQRRQHQKQQRQLSKKPAATPAAQGKM